MFSPRFPDNRTSHFCYEADCGSMPMADMLKKFRAYYHFIKRQQKHKEAFGVHPSRTPESAAGFDDIATSHTGYDSRSNAH